MLQYERFEIIMQMLDSRSSVRVADLSRALGVSESTVRRDIRDLAEAGRLRKVFGGAVTIDEDGNGRNSAGGERIISARSVDLDVKEGLRTDEKIAVASRAAELIEKNDLIYIDAGTTTGNMIDRITCTTATYVTNGVRHAMRMAAKGLTTYLVSGRVKAYTEAVIGHEAVDYLRKYHFSKCFIGTDGIDRESGLTTSDIEESMVKTEAIRRSREVYILADSSKFGLVASVTFGPLDAGTVITDRLPNPEYREEVRLMEVSG